MITMLIEMAAAEHRSELRQAAERFRVSSGVGQSGTPGLEIRHARSRDADVVWRLAALDEEAALEGPVLLASLDGRPVAALSLDDGRVVADPFVATVQAVSLLRARADQLTHAKGRRRWLRWRLPRLRLA
jgi:hypothetical protein